MKCTRCGALIPDDARFCTSCGSPTVPAPVYCPPKQDDGKALLIVVVVIVLLIVLPLVLAGVMYIMVMGFTPAIEEVPSLSARIEQADARTLEMTITQASPAARAGTVLFFAQANNSFGSAFITGTMLQTLTMGDREYTVTFHDQDSDGLIEGGDSFRMECASELPDDTTFAMGLSMISGHGVLVQTTYRS